MNERSPASRPTYVRFAILALLMSLCFVGHFNRVSISVAGTEQMIEEFDVSPTKMGTVYSAYLLFYTLCMIPGGWLIDRRGAKFALAAMFIGSVPLVFATGQVRFLAASALAVPTLWVVRSLLGVVSAPLHPGAARMVWAWTPLKSAKRRQRTGHRGCPLGLCGNVATVWRDDGLVGLAHGVCDLQLRDRGIGRGVDRLRGQ